MITAIALLAATLGNIVGPCAPLFPPEDTVITLALPRVAYEREAQRRAVDPRVAGFYFRLAGTRTHYVVLPNDAMGAACHEWLHVQVGPVHLEDVTRRE